MSNNINIEVDKSFLEKLFGLADMPSPDNPSLEDLHSIVEVIKKKFDNILLSQAALPSSGGSGNIAKSAITSTSGGLGQTTDQGDSQRSKSILIVDDLGIITYQLETLFSKLGFETAVSREMYDAIDKFKKQDFGYTILDLFIPTEREGFYLLDEIKKLSLLCKLDTKIIVMSASSKKEFKENCINRGADSFIEKTQGWQKRIVDACLNNKKEGNLIE